MTPPASTEPMYLVSESELDIIRSLFSMPEHSMEDEDYQAQDNVLANIRARGPVVEQVPAAGYQFSHIHDEECNGCPKMRTCEGCESVHHLSIRESQEARDKMANRDAALIAQEREKWERERDQKYVLTLSTLREISADVELTEYRKSCIHDPVCQWLCTAGNCPFHVALDRHNAAIAAQARGDVLKRLHLVVPLCDALIEKFDCQSQLGFNALLIKRELESLRSEVGK